MEHQTLYRARYLLPICGAPIEDGAMLVANGRILAIGTFRELSSAHPGVDVVDFEDAIILPPFVNAHTHLELTAFADWAEEAAAPASSGDFVDWILWLVKVRQTVTEEQVADSLSKGLDASLQSGTGAVGDICTTLGASTAYMKSSLRGRVFAEILGQDLDRINQRLDEIRAVTRQNPSHYLEWGISPHAPYTLSALALDRVFAYASEEGLQGCIHLAESNAEKRFLQAGTGEIAEKLYAAAKWSVNPDDIPGCSPVESLCREGRFTHGWLAVHGVEVDERDLRLFKKHGCSVVLCPRSNARLECNKAPVAQYLDSGINLAIGTDSLASSPSLSIWDELAFACEWFAGDITPRQWLEIATHGGAKALGLYEQMGCLLPGHEASFQVVSLPNLPAPQALEEALCTAGSKINVTHLYLAAQNCLPKS